MHSAMCVKALSNVFQLKDTPWIKIHTGITDELINTTYQRSFGAFSYHMNDESEAPSQSWKLKSKC